MSRDQLSLPGNGMRWVASAGLVGLAGWIACAALVPSAGVERFFRSYLVAFAYGLSLALGALFFVLITHLTRAGWSVVLRRVAESVAMAILPLGLLALLIFLGRAELYSWARPEAIADSPHLAHKVGYLNSSFFALRLLLYFVIWGAMVLFFRARSLRQDRDGGSGPTLAMERFAAPGMILFALTVTFAAFDLIMALYPLWYSTIFGVYYFAGMTVAIFSLLVVLSTVLQRSGKLIGVVTTEHLHDLGKLMFAFVVFWAYIAFSQYMLIWYASIPEETSWYLVRQSGPWAGLSLFLLFGHFVFPFLLLMSRYPKRRHVVLVAAACWLLFMHWFDLFWLVMPEASPDSFPFHLLDLATMLAVIGTIGAFVFWNMGRAPLIPLRDPRLSESLEFQSV